jgi:integrase/DNA-directed RNA polymerase subunit M/transcription elongation factor TFIIS
LKNYRRTGEKAYSSFSNKKELAVAQEKAKQTARHEGFCTPQRKPQPQCPQCGSKRLYKDGLRYLADGDAVQRWLCRSCGYRFSNLNQKKNCAKSNMFQHVQKIQTLNLKTLNALNNNRQVGVRRKSGAKNLVEVARHEKAQREGTKPDAEIVKGLIVKYMAWLENQGYKSAKNRVNMIKRLVDLGANLLDPESVKLILAKREGWQDGYKMLMTYAYESFLKMEGLSWERPRYTQEQTLPFIPAEEELDQLIAGVGKKVGTFLQGLKDTGADPGELAKLRLIDVNMKNKTVNIRPVKGHNPRILKVSSEFIRRLQNMPKKSEYIFNYDSLKSGYNDARRHLAHKLNNPRLLSITFTTFRHWKGTMEYHKTRDILHVKQLLGHKKIQSTMIYINLEAALFTDRHDEFHFATAKTVEEAGKLIEVGFEYVCHHEGAMLFRKRK